MDLQFTMLFLSSFDRSLQGLTLLTATETDQTAAYNQLGYVRL